MHNVMNAPVSLLAPGFRNDAKRTFHVATLHDGQKGRWLDRRLREVVPNLVLRPHFLLKLNDSWLFARLVIRLCRDQ